MLKDVDSRTLKRQESIPFADDEISSECDEDLTANETEVRIS